MKLLFNIKIGHNNLRIAEYSSPILVLPRRIIPIDQKLDLDTRLIVRAHTSTIFMRLVYS